MAAQRELAAATAGADDGRRCVHEVIDNSSAVERKSKRVAHAIESVVPAHEPLPLHEA